MDLSETKNSQSQLDAFKPSFSERKVVASLTFPDRETALGFLALGQEEGRALDANDTLRETPLGPVGQYDAFISSPDTESGEVVVGIRHYGRTDPRDAEALREFLTKTAAKLSDSQTSTD